GFGIVFVEAALRGTPSIAGRSGGTSDAVSEDVSGWLVDAQDHRQLEEMLRVLMADPDRLSRMRSGARDWAMSLFPSHRDHSPLIELLEER
ncbi:MAG TPA: glycosyltransferase, partial [Candidatus Sumerlaeota bacterium]|nr:glycosyltransferase [Candidatus Sumerlaeota bacterium]